MSDKTIVVGAHYPSWGQVLTYFGPDCSFVVYGFCDPMRFCKPALSFEASEDWPHHRARSRDKVSVL